MSGTVSVRRLKGSRHVYSSSFLLDDLPNHCDGLSADEFASYQCATLRKFNPSLNATVFSVTKYRGNPDGALVEASVLGGHNWRSEHLEIYRNVEAPDIMASASWHHTGSAVFNSFYMPDDMWKQHDLHRRLNEPLGLNEVVLLNFCYPFHQSTRIRFTYRTEAPSYFGDDLTKDEVEYYSLPFFFAWLKRDGVIDRDTMIAWLSLLVGITPLRLVLLRELTSHRRYRNSATADKLRISSRVVNNQFHEIYNSVADHLPASGRDDGYQSKLVDLANAFAFLRFSGEYQSADTIRKCTEREAAPIVARMTGLSSVIEQV